MYHAKIQLNLEITKRLGNYFLYFLHSPNVVLSIVLSTCHSNHEAMSPRKSGNTGNTKQTVWMFKKICLTLQPK